MRSLEPFPGHGLSALPETVGVIRRPLPALIGSHSCEVHDKNRKKDAGVFMLSVR